MIFYKARDSRTGNMWDTWVCFNDGIYHLYYLANSGDKGWDNISMATSPDGVRWSERGPILLRRPTSIWMGTGSTWKSPHFQKDGKFQMNFSASEGPTRRQTIFFAESTDLVNWTRLGDEYEFAQDERWYQREGRWDCIFTVQRPGGGLYGYLTATPKDSGRFGFARSDDGVKWEALPPPEADVAGDGEVGAVAFMAGRYYMMYGSGGSLQMFTLVADRPEGPFRPARRNFKLLTGHTYFTRFFTTPEGVLINHHSIARDGQVYGAPFKKAVIDSDGTLRMHWWGGNEGMKHESLPVQPPVRSGSAVAMPGNVFDMARGVVLEGTLAVPSAGEPALCGLCIECVNGDPIAVTVSSDGTAHLGPIGPDGSGFRPDKQANREMAFRSPAAFRLLIEHSLVEFYLDDVLMECYSLPAPAGGRIGLLGEAAVLRAWKAP